MHTNLAFPFSQMNIKSALYLYLLYLYVFSMLLQINFFAIEGHIYQEEKIPTCILMDNNLYRSWQRLKASCPLKASNEGDVLEDATKRKTLSLEQL